MRRSSALRVAAWGIHGLGVQKAAIESLVQMYGRYEKGYDDKQSKKEQ